MFQLGTWNIADWKNESSISQYWRVYHNILVIFSDSINFSQSSLMFPSSWYQIVAVWMVSSCAPWVVGFGILECSRMKVPFHNIEGVILIFYQFFSDSVNFFQTFLVFSSCRDLLGAFWLILRCVTLPWVFWHLKI